VPSDLALQKRPVLNFPQTFIPSVDYQQQGAKRVMTTSLLSTDIISIVLYTVVGAILGGLLVLWIARYVPRMIDRLTPHIDEQRELARGNQAVALFYGLVSASVILGVSLVVAAAVLGGLQSGAGILSPPYTVKQHLSGGSAEVPDARGNESTADTVSP
jgi:hypothetical protein